MWVKSIVVTSILFFASCTFNKMYYAPTLIPEKAKKVRMVDQETKDTTFIVLEPTTHQPTFTNSKEDEKQLNYIVTSHNFQSSNGNTINAWMLSPKNNLPKASILFLHGNSGNIITQFPGLIPLVGRGYQIFIFDYSGYGFSTGNANRTNVLKDAKAALDYFKALPQVTNTKQLIYGQSLGGHLATVLAEQHQDRIDALVIEGAFSSHKDIAARTAGFLGRWIVKEKYSAKESIKSFKKPVLIIHSIEDETIPFKMGKTLYKNANDPKQFYEIKGAHIAAPVLYPDSIAAKIDLLLNRN